MRIFIWIALFLIVVTIVILRSKRKSATSDVSDQKIAKPERWPQINTVLHNNPLPSQHISLINAKPLTVTQSKVGGQPYWPKEMTYPLDGDNKNLTFIAQINLTELDSCPIDLPLSGLLQFFIKIDDLLGLSFFESTSELHTHINNDNTNYLVIYHAEATDHDDALFANQSIIVEDESPVSGQCGLLFTSTLDIATPQDYRWNNIVKELAPFSDEEIEYACEPLRRTGEHKIGGFAYFTQQDPREYIAPDEDWILLFQLDSESNDHIDIMWGDCGIAQFFIKKEDLKALRFDRVWYNWDCC